MGINFLILQIIGGVWHQIAVFATLSASCVASTFVSANAIVGGFAAFGEVVGVGFEVHGGRG